MYIIFLLLFLITPLIMLVGLAKPSLIKSITRTVFSRKKIAGIFGSAIVAWFVLFGITAPPVEDVPAAKPDQVAVVTTTTDQELEVDVSSEDQEEDLQKQEESRDDESDEIIEDSAEYYTVTKVVDGDTFDVLINGETIRIRTIGMDTPETVDPRKPVQCFGPEASNKTKELLMGQKVRLEKDPTQGELDKYGRLLAFVYREDGLFFNKWMIENGYAFEYTYNVPYNYMEAFKTAENQARENNLGLWGDVCDEQPETTNNATVETPPQTSTDSSESGPWPVSGSSPSAPVNAGSCTIKGNINSDGEKLYHYEGCPSYSRTKIDESKGERWFCSEKEAQDAGWVRAGNC